MGPTGQYLDNRFFTTPTGTNSIQGYSANSNTYLFTGTLAQPQSQGIVLQPGRSNSFDECGAWLNSIYKETATHWLGWYHAEHNCNYSAGVTYKSMAFVESTDAGKTWTKTKYPKNQVLTPFNTQYNEGDGRVIAVGSYFYMFYLDTIDYKIHIARATISSEGRPGSWYKYYNGSFSQPGLGGNSSAVNPNLIEQFVTPNTYLNNYLSLFISGKWGFTLNYAPTSDMFNWTANPSTLFPPVSTSTDTRVDDWSTSRPTTDLSLYGYPSLIDVSGSSDSLGQNFYLYYMKVFPGGNMSQRYLMRRLLTVNSTTSSFSSWTPLVEYKNSSTNRTKDSTEIAKPSEGYSKSSVLGSVLTYQASGTIPLYECYIPSFSGYYDSTVNPSQYNWQHCESAGDSFVRTIGYISPTQTTDFTTPIYRCYNSTTNDHYVSSDSTCGGNSVDYQLGFILPAQ